MDNKIINIGGVFGNFSEKYVNERICGMEDTETYFFNKIFDNSIDIVERNEFVYSQFESFITADEIDEIGKILNSNALFDTNGSIIKTIIILSTGLPGMENRIVELNNFLVNKYGH